MSSSSGPCSSPGAGAKASSAGTCAAAVSSRRRRACSLRSWSVSRREATVTSQARGLSGTPSCGHWTVAASSASCTASSHASKRPYRRTRMPRTCGARRAQQVDVVVGRAHISAPEVSISARTSSGEKRALGHRNAISAARSALSQSTIR